ncbi:MAG: proline--tRNA ligase [Betaproteobacteria bacterium RIFCSPLOWO2_02_FULL_62_17]|nr:MAG: proline--tRNA ligase [Betaproteobacteria bacterium RIFCSPLOWO2_02_FULL_62_17]
MRVSSFFLSTLKEAPADAEVISHRLMLRAGLIRRLAGGIYTWMPMGLRVVRKVEAIVREEMNRAGAVELLMPSVQPAELWQESGRWQMYGPELLRLKDRHDRSFCVGPTHEEVITDVARRELRSYRQLPVHFYQIQTKFRDEIRPRFGVMRGREFVMKDGYSFHASYENLHNEYIKMHETYTRIFTRLGLHFRAVSADTGSIGGTGSHEFHVLAESGEDAIAYCPASDYAANIELAEASAPTDKRRPGKETISERATPGKTRCQEVAEFLGVSVELLVKTIAIVRESAGENSTPQFALVLLRGDHDLNEKKTSRILGTFRFASDDEIKKNMHCQAGYIGPARVNSIPIFADRSVVAMSDFVCGANKEDFHLTGVNWGTADLPDIPDDRVADFRNVMVGDRSPDGKGTLDIVRGIEVGHIFQLRTKYSQMMNATFLDKNGASQPFEMGCYGIGITRIVGAAIEQGHDDRGIIFPPAIAPFTIALVPVGYHKSEAVRRTADSLHLELEQCGFDVILDDRDERPGVMFADMELLGIPHRVTIGERGLKQQVVEYQSRLERESRHIPIQDSVRDLRNILC